MFIFVRKADKERVIRIPETGQDLLPGGQNVVDCPYWRERIKDGLVLLGRPAVKKTKKKTIISK